MTHHCLLLPPPLLSTPPRSPDADMHIIVVEPQQCSYVVELYVPELCALPGFQVSPPPVGTHPGVLAKPKHRWYSCCCCRYTLGQPTHTTTHPLTHNREPFALGSCESHELAC